jgi:hypothetical protein
MTEIDITALIEQGKKLAEAATQGKWVSDSNDEGCDRFKQKARAIGDALEGLKNV